MSDVTNNFSQEEINALKNDMVLNTEKSQLEDANMIAQLLSEDSDNKEDLYLSILSYYSNKENKKELDTLMLKLAGPDS